MYAHHRSDHCIFRPKSLIKLTYNTHKRVSEWRSSFFILSSPQEIPFPTRWNLDAGKINSGLPERSLSKYEDNVLNYFVSSGDAPDPVNTTIAVNEFLLSGGFVNSTWRMAYFEGMNP